MNYNININNKIEEQAVIRPNSPALTFENQTLTYQQLNKKATLLSETINNVNNETLNSSRVCVVMNRNLGLVISLIAIHKLKACYVPIDNHYPKERQQYIFTDCKANFVITDEQTVVDNILNDDNCINKPTVVLVDSNGNFIKAFSDNNSNNNNNAKQLEQQQEQQNLAYILYTSGSTGNPKGVMIDHRTVLNIFDSFTEELAMGEGCNWLAVTTFCFDISVLEIFLPLTTGAHLFLASTKVQKNAQLIINTLKTCNITHMQATPATFKMMMKIGWMGQEDLTILCGGEAFPSNLLALIPNTKAVWNVYGPTEATIWCTLFRFPKDHSDPKCIPIGKAASHVKLYILNEHMKEVADGEIGRLFIAGDCLAVGYWERPDLSADKFVQDIFSNNVNDRMYDAGDLVRRLPCGNIDYISRADEQIKLRGYRIEIGEVSATVESHPDIETAIVMVVEDDEEFGGEAALVAYIQLKPNANIKVVTTLRKYMLGKSPSYMCPAAFKVIEKMPLTPNGKIDKKQLAKHVKDIDFDMLMMNERQNSSQNKVTGCQYEIDRIISLVEDMTGAKVEANSDLAIIGLDSFGAMMFLKRFNKIFSTDFKIEQVVKQPTIKALAELVAEKSGSSRQNPITQNTLQEDTIAKILDLVEDMTGASVSENSDLSIVGLDSFGAMMFLKRFNKVFATDFKIDEIVKQPSIRALADLVTGRSDHFTIDVGDVERGEEVQKPIRNSNLLNGVRFFLIIW
eukprot:Pgem_evm1s15311